MVAIVQQARNAAVRRTTQHHGQRLVWHRWGSGPLLVLLHGNAGSWTHWVRNVLPLARRFTVLVPDLPGHGESDAAAGEISFAAFAALLWEGVDQLAAADAPIALAGFSLGSVLAESMAYQQPARARQVLLLRGSFAPGFPRQPDMLRWRGVQDPGELARIHRHNLAASMFHDPARIDGAAIAIHADNLVRARLDTRPLLATRQFEAFNALACPVHGISGEFDVYGGGPGQEQELKAALPQATFHLVKGAGHWAAYEAADDVNASMLDFLAREILQQA